jgi:hypothetical protein
MSSLLITGGPSLVSADSESFGHGTYGSCYYNQCGITISSNGTVNVNVTPTAAGRCTVQKDSVTVTTDDSDGYTVTLNTSGTSNSLNNGSNSITVSTGSQASPISLANNTWGYRVDGVSGFGAGSTTAQSSVSTPSYPFAAVPTSSQSGDVLVSSNAAANPAVTTNVWYGVCATTSLPSGTYSAQVVYTAVAN